MHHTERVVKHTKEIAEHYNLSSIEKFILIAAAWVHDTGQLIAEMEIYEEASVSIIQHLMAKEHIDTFIIDGIAGCKPG